MKVRVCKGWCPECDIALRQTWLVLGPNGDCWKCSRDYTTALRYAIERAHQEQPGTGDQVHNTVSKEQTQ